jgi:hypothetical protein
LVSSFNLFASLHALDALRGFGQLPPNDLQSNNDAMLFALRTTRAFGMRQLFLDDASPFELTIEDVTPYAFIC